MAFSLHDALHQIGTNDYSGVTGLRRLADETSLICAGAIENPTLLFCAGDVQGKPAWLIGDELSRQSKNANGLKQIITIEDTPIGELLVHADFTLALFCAARRDRATFNRILNGKDASGLRRIASDSLWDTALARFASSASGKILTLTANAPSDSVFVQSIFCAALNSRASTINNAIREDLLRARDDLVAKGKATDRPAAEKMILDYINFESRIASSYLEISTKKN